MMEQDKNLRQSFKAELPESPNVDMWVDETYIEYRRFQKLNDEGHDVRPVRNSLLAKFISINSSQIHAVDVMKEGPAIYKETFGHEMPYCWTRDASKLGSDADTRSSAPAPGTAWMGSKVGF